MASTKVRAAVCGAQSPTLERKQIEPTAGCALKPCMYMFTGHEQVKRNEDRVGRMFGLPYAAISHCEEKEVSDGEGLRDGDQEPSTARCSRVLVVAVYITAEGMPFNDKKGFGGEKEVHNSMIGPMQFGAIW
ncbi:hypothetical protein R3P38DRAFT_2784726 [Favolaschia claudopus]|uniref:Uncharacterized protein n=1 Tax=Favolaschia claudopus TaxID=2862362 RepID=A0AAW0B0B0_9AGAR